MSKVQSNEIDYHAATLQILIDMSESDLQARIVEPLLRLSGFEDVRDQSGPGEKGKDLTAVKYELGKPKLYAIQIKKFKFTGKASGTKSLNYVLPQLRQTIIEPVFDRLSNTYRKPDRGIFITPFQISRGALESAIQQITDFENREISIIDGPILVDLVLKHMPHAVPEIGSEFIYRMQLAKEVDNIPESSAFGLEEDLSLDNIYVDINVSVGMPARVTTKDKFDYIPVSISEIQIIENFYKSWINEEPPIQIAKHIISDSKKTHLLKAKRLEELRKKYRESEEIYMLKAKRLEENDIKIVKINLDSINNSFQTFISNYSRDLKKITDVPINKVELNNKILEGIEVSKDFLSVLNIPIFDSYLPRVNQPSSVISAGRAVSVQAKIVSDIDHPVFITGEPGSGKTTLLRRVAQNISRSAKGNLPILLYLVRIQETTEEALIRECIAELNTLGYEKNMDDTYGFLREIDAGKYKLLLDGLDETGTLSTSLFQTIQQFSKNHPHCPIVVTCRNTSILDLWPDAFYLCLRPFSDSQMRIFTDRWFRAEPSLSESLITWLDNNVDVKEIARTPVMTAVLCSLHQVEAEIPTTVAALYESRFDLLLGKWEKVKNIKPMPSKIRERYLHFLIILAMHMHQKQIRYININDIIELYHMQYLDDINALNIDRIRRDGQMMVFDCIRRGLLIRETKNFVSFGHLTNQEFLAAKYLSRENPITLIIDNLDKPWWQRTIQFYSMMQKDITRLLQIYLRNHEKIAYDTWEYIKTLTKLAPLTNRRVLAKWRYLPRF